MFYVVPTVQAQRRSKEHSRSTSALSGLADEKSEVSPEPDQHTSLYSNGFMTSSMGNDPHAKTKRSENASRRALKQRACLSSAASLFPGYQTAKTVELQQRSSSVVTQQTTVSSIPSQPSTTGVSHTFHTNTHGNTNLKVRKIYLLMFSSAGQG